MRPDEELELPPWTKWNKFGIFPTKLCVHISLLALVTAQAFVLNGSFASYSRSMDQAIVDIFFPDDFASSQTDLTSPYQYFIFTIANTISDSNLLVDSYFSFPDVSLNLVDIYSANGTVEQPYVSVVDRMGHRTKYSISNASDPLWPLSNENPDIDDLPYVQDFLQNLGSMTFFFFFKSYGSYASIDNRPTEVLCYNWQLRFDYDLGSTGQILVSSTASVKSSVIVTALAAWYQLLLLKAVTREVVLLNWIRLEAKMNFSFSDELDEHHNVELSGSGPSLAQNINPLTPRRPSEDSASDASLDEVGVLVEARESLSRASQLPTSHDQFSSAPAISGASQRTSSWWLRERRDSLVEMEKELADLRQAMKSLAWRDLLSVFNLWFFLALIGNIAVLLYSVRVVFELVDIESHTSMKTCLGLACFMLWFCLAQYLEFFPKYYVMISMLKKTAPRVSRFLLGVLPIFIGYALLGMLTFGDKVDRFGDILQTMRSLFAVVNGDIIYDTFSAVAITGLGAEVYMYFFIMLFTYVVLMTIIAIVEEAFFEAQGHHRTPGNVTADDLPEPGTHTPHSKGSFSGGQSSGRGSEATAPRRSEGNMHLSSHSSSDIRSESSGTLSRSASRDIIPPRVKARAGAGAGAGAGAVPSASEEERRLTPKSSFSEATAGRKALPDSVKNALRGIDLASEVQRRRSILSAATTSGKGDVADPNLLSGSLSPDGSTPAATSGTTTATPKPTKELFPRSMTWTS